MADMETCKRGHEVNEKNSRLDRTGHRVCRICHRESVKDFYKRHPRPKKRVPGIWRGLTALDRFLRNVATPEIPRNYEAPCWIWIGRTVVRSVDGKPYGLIHYEGRQQTAHRVAYMLFRGRIPEGYEGDHRCRNTLCVNPWHIDPVPHRINCIRGRQGAYLRERIHCPKGHPYDEQNTLWLTSKNGGQRRDCKTCATERKRAYKLKMKGKR